MNMIELVVATLILPHFFKSGAFVVSLKIWYSEADICIPPHHIGVIAYDSTRNHGQYVLDAETHSAL